MTLHHPNIDCLPLTSGFLHGRIGLLGGQKYFCYSSQYASSMSFPLCFTSPYPTKPGSSTCNGGGTGMGVRRLALMTWLCILASLCPPLGLGFLKGKISLDQSRGQQTFSVSDLFLLPSRSELPQFNYPRFHLPSGLIKVSEARKVLG